MPPGAAPALPDGPACGGDGGGEVERRSAAAAAPPGPADAICDAVGAHLEHLICLQRCRDTDDQSARSPGSAQRAARPRPRSASWAAPAVAPPSLWAARPPWGASGRRGRARKCTPNFKASVGGTAQRSSQIFLWAMLRLAAGVLWPSFAAAARPPCSTPLQLLCLIPALQGTRRAYCVGLELGPRFLPPRPTTAKTGGREEEGG